jgi:hypothetical protein
MKRRDHRKFNAAIAKCMDIFLQRHPDAIDAILFKADHAHQETSSVMSDVVGSMEAEERALTYLSPVVTRIFPFPPEAVLSADDYGDHCDGNMDQPIAVLIEEPDVPKQSIIQYEEYISPTEVRAVALYVVHAEMLGGEAGKKYYCMPFQAFDFEFIEPPVNATPASEATILPDAVPTLFASAFIVHGTNDTHGKSQWRVRTAAGNYTTPYYDSTAITDLISHVLPNPLPLGAYFWQVRYRGADGDKEGDVAIWSDWSDETGFAVVEEEVE